jgi:hypothetical protein
MGWVVQYMCLFFFFEKLLLGSVPLQLEHSWDVAPLPQVVNRLEPPMDFCSSLIYVDPLQPFPRPLLTPTVVQIRFATHNSLRSRLRLSLTWIPYYSLYDKTVWRLTMQASSRALSLFVIFGFGLPLVTRADMRINRIFLLQNEHWSLDPKVKFESVLR